MSGRSAELLLGHVLAGHRLHDVGPGDEHVRRPLGHQDEIGDRGRVDGPAGARPENQRDLRHDARGLDVAPEDLGVAGERDDALLDPRAARVVDPDDGAADLDGHVHHLADLLGEDLAQRAAEHGEVLREHAHRPAEHRAVARDDRVTPGALLAHPELDLTVAHETVELDERPRVEQPLDAAPARAASRARAASTAAFSPGGRSRLGAQLREPAELRLGGVVRHPGALVHRHRALSLSLTPGVSTGGPSRGGRRGSSMPALARRRETAGGPAAHRPGALRQARERRATSSTRSARA